MLDSVRSVVVFVLFFEPSGLPRPRICELQPCHRQMSVLGATRAVENVDKLLTVYITKCNGQRFRLYIREGILCGVGGNLCKR
jgi:hypothetical protein